MPYLSASAVVIHYEEALYQVYVPLPFKTRFSLSVLVLVFVYVLLCCLLSSLSMYSQFAFLCVLSLGGSG